MNFLLRILLLSKDWTIAATLSLAAMPFIPIKYQNTWTFGGIAAWIMILKAILLRVTEKVTREKTQAVSQETATGMKDEKENR
jgi:hypothetical protein